MPQLTPLQQLAALSTGGDDRAFTFGKAAAR